MAQKTACRLQTLCGLTPRRRINFRASLLPLVAGPHWALGSTSGCCSPYSIEQQQGPGLKSDVAHSTSQTGVLEHVRQTQHISSSQYVSITGQELPAWRVGHCHLLNFDSLPYLAAAWAKSCRHEEEVVGRHARGVLSAKRQQRRVILLREG